MRIPFATCLCLVLTLCGVQAGDQPEEAARVGQDELSPPITEPMFGSTPSRSEDGGRPYWRRNLFKRVLDDQKFLVTSWWPAEVRRFSFTVPLAVALAGASGSSHSGSSVDLRWQRSMESWTTGGRRDSAEAFTRLGDNDSAVVLLGSAYLISRWTGNERMQRATSLSTEALVNTAIYTGLLKRLTNRTRPASAGTGDFFVLNPQGGQEATSFPSGHATGAFAVAAVFSWEFRDKRWVPWVAYGTASLIAASRVSLGRHFPSDVLAGAVLGHSMGRMVAHQAGAGDESPLWTRFEPLVEPRNRGVGIAYRYSW